jgi:hypothetical protein
MERKLIELVIDEDAGAFGVEAISLVKEPAIEVNWVAFNKQGRTHTVHLAQVDEEQRTLIAPALIPDLKIVRFDEETDTEYDVFFSKDTVKQASELFIKQHRTNNHTFEHAEPVEGVSVVESWIVQDPKMDKAKLYGFNDLKEGTWMVRAKVENEEVWNKIKKGEAKGLSIEGFFLDKVENLSKAKKNKTMLEAIYDAVVGKRQFYKEAKLTSGNVLVTESDEFSAGVAVYSLGDDGQPVSLDNGKYTTEGGIELEVYDGVLIEYDGEVQAVEEQAEPVEATPEPVAMDAMKVSYYKALLKNRSARYLSKSSKVDTLHQTRQVAMSAKTDAQRIIWDNLDAWGEDGEGLSEAISDIALNVDPELESRVYDPLMEASKASSKGDLDAVRDHLAEAYDYADSTMQIYIDELTKTVGTLEQYS